MKSSSCAIAFAALVLCAGAQAQPSGDVLPLDAPASDSAPAGRSGQAPAAAAPRASRPAFFAASSVAGVKRLTPDRKLAFRFIKEQAAASRYELDASKLALGKSGNPAVRSLAASLISHHNQAGLELLHLLHTRGMAAPMLGNDQFKKLSRLGKLSGTAFDKSYMDEMALKQREDLREFEKARVAVQEPQIKAWIDKNLPTLQYHQSLAERGLATDTQQRMGKGAPQSGGKTIVQTIGTTATRPPVVPGQLNVSSSP